MAQQPRHIVGQGPHLHPGPNTGNRPNYPWNTPDTPYPTLATVFITQPYRRYFLIPIVTESTPVLLAFMTNRARPSPITGPGAKAEDGVTSLIPSLRAGIEGNYFVRFGTPVTHGSDGHAVIPVFEGRNTRASTYLGPPFALGPNGGAFLLAYHTPPWESIGPVDIAGKTPPIEFPRVIGPSGSDQTSLIIYINECGSTSILPVHSRGDVYYFDAVNNTLCRVYYTLPATEPFSRPYIFVLRAPYGLKIPGPAIPVFEAPLSPLDGPEGTFWRFTFLPPEIRAMIFRHAMITPGIVYFTLTSAHFFTGGMGMGMLSGETLPHATPGCNSNIRQWRTIGQTCWEATRAVNNALARSTVKRYADKGREYCFNKDADLAVFFLSPVCQTSGMASWNTILTSAQSNIIYSRWGKGLLRVGIEYGGWRRQCYYGNHLLAGDDLEQAIQRDQWRIICFREKDSRCKGACKDALCRYVSFFRDAEAIYFMVRLTDISLAPYVILREKHKALESVGVRITCIQKYYNMDTWQDNAYTWVQVNSDLAKELLSCEARRPWKMADYLNKYISHLRQPQKAQLNPKMRVKVLVTMENLRWNKGSSTASNKRKG